MTRKALIKQILMYIERRRDWDRDTPFKEIVKSEVAKWGRYSKTDRYNTNLTNEILKLYEKEKVDDILYK